MTQESEQRSPDELFHSEVSQKLFDCGFHEESEYSIVEVIEVLYNGIIIIGW